MSSFSDRIVNPAHRCSRLLLIQAYSQHCKQVLPTVAYTSIFPALQTGAPDCCLYKHIPITANRCCRLLLIQAYSQHCKQVLPTCLYKQIPSTANRCSRLLLIQTCIPSSPHRCSRLLLIQTCVSSTARRCFRLQHVLYMRAVTKLYSINSFRRVHNPGYGSVQIICCH